MESPKKEATCWICAGEKDGWFKHRCETHDICDVCKTKRADIQGIPWATRTGFICQPCLEARQAKAIADFEKTEHRDLDFWGNDKIKCPFCGHEYENSDLHESTDEEDCPECGSIMTVEVEWSATYSTAKPKPNPKDS